MRVTKSTPTGSATRRTSHAPRLPTPVRRAVLTAQPTRPPAIVALRSAAPWDKALDACATSPAALTRSTASPVNGRTPRVTGGRTNAEAPQAPSRSGKRKPAYPKDWKAAQPSHTPTGPTGLCCPARGRGEDCALAGDGDRDRDQAVLGEELAVAEHDGADLADGLAVDEDAAGREAADDARGRLRHLHAGPVLDQEDLVRLEADRLGEPRVAEQVSVLAVHRDEVARTREVQHQLQVLLASVAGDVDEGVVLVEDLGAQAIQGVDHAADRPLVARDYARRDDHEVAGLHLHVLVLGRGHERERRVGLALAPRREDHLARGLERGELLERHQEVGRDPEVAELGGDRDVLLHAHAEEGDPPPLGRGEREDLLDPVDVRREGRDDDAPGRAREPLRERPPDLHLRARVAGPVDVRGVGAEHEHALAAELGEPPVVGRLAVERARIELEVSRVHECANRRPDREADAVRDRVRDTDRLDDERADLDAVARPDRPKIGTLVEPVLAEPLGDQRARQRRAEDGYARLPEQVGRRADMVQVCAGNAA